MKTKTILALAFLGLIASIGGLAASAPEKPTVAPETSKVTFENDKVRVIEYHTHSGKNICGLGMHSHPAHVYVMLTPGKLRVVTPDGKEEIVDSKAGESGWEPAVTHIAECISGPNASCVLVEIKDKDWKPSTGMTN
jgi:hypothetical protein